MSGRWNGRTRRRGLWVGVASSALLAVAVFASMSAEAAAPIAAAATPTVPPAAYPNPGVITGDTGAHDPSIVKTRPGGTSPHTPATTCC